MRVEERIELYDRWLNLFESLEKKTKKGHENEYNGQNIK
jgi:hypothetical protein